ncbi:hypothetical protein HHL19_18175 [Streptomyces sp. R302]|uniref:hypothetical protein n=1 Tax=unclassified Streptomyces TaxID=2593676 RepID=UPI00145CF514|nr:MULTISPECIES: hypothetical protein [unclassified Streptomyces]NML52521.1 hypothetical protein [Streptomyces sp. R301]NML80550.1 hypothetical protein [Streptomyces sp. R302]
MSTHRRRPPLDPGIGLEGVQEAGTEQHEKLREAWARLAKEGRTWTPFLVVPYKPVVPVLPGQTPDLGRIRPVPAGEAFWASPYIVVENSGGIGLTARAGEDNFVHARVFNFGRATSAPTQVDFYWADPSLGVSAGTCRHIGTEWAEIRHGASLDVRCRTPWIPEFLNGGHECLVVNTSNPTATASPGSVFGPFDPIQVPFGPRLDRHVGQRNLTVEPAQGGSTAMTLTLTNPLPFSARMLVTLRADMFEIDAEHLAKTGETEVLTGLAALAGDPDAPKEGPVRRVGRPPAVKVSVGEVVGTVPTDATRDYAAALVQHVGRGADPAAGEVVATARMRAGEQRGVEIVADAVEPKAGWFTVVTLGQLWEDLPLGGYTLVGVVA